MPKPTLEACFDLGRVRTTRSALNKCGQDALKRALSRHSQGDWGDAPDEMKRINDEGVATSSQLCSMYRLDGGSVWIITSADRTHTTILLDGEQGQTEDYA